MAPFPLALYAQHQIELEEDIPCVYEYCRLLAALHRDKVLAQPDEKRINIMPNMQEILVLDEWHHPDIVDEELPSQNKTFQQLAQLLATGDVSLYCPNQAANTHWKNWPDGGTL